MGRAEELITEAIVDGYGSVAKFADVINVPKTTLYTTLERGIRSNNSVDVMLRIFKELNLDADAFVDGMVRERDADPDYIDVPLYGCIAAGVPIDMSPIDDYFPVPRPVAERYPDGFLLKVVGESMNRKLPNGTYAYIAPTDDVQDNKAYAVCVNGDAATIKRVRKLANGCELIPDSTDPTFKPELYDFGEEGTPSVTPIGRVVYFVIPFDYEI